MDNYLARCTLKVAIDEAPKEESDQEVVANNLDVDPEVFPLIAEEGIVKNCPKRKINLIAIASCILPVWEIQG